MLCKGCEGNAVYMWYHIHVVHMVLVHKWYCVHVIHVVLRACGIMYVHYVGACIVLCTRCRHIYCIVYIGYRCMSCVVYRVYMYAFCGVARYVWMYIFCCTLCIYMYVHQV